MKFHLHTSTSGYLLIEAMVAMTVLTTGVLGIFALMSQSIKLTRVIDDQYIATYLAAEGIEIAKNLLDANPVSAREWNELGFNGNGCYEIDIATEQLNSAPSVVCATGSATPLRLSAQSVYQYAAGEATDYRRTVEIQVIDEIGVRVVSTVKWAGGDSSVALEDKFYDWH